MRLRDKNICICIWSENFEKLAKWYETVLAFPVRKRLSFPTDTGVDFDFGDNYFFIGRHDKVKGYSRDPFRIMIGFNVDSVGETYAMLKKKKVEVIAEPFLAPEGTFWCMTITDPEGNILQFYGDK